MVTLLNTNFFFIAQTAFYTIQKSTHPLYFPNDHSLRETSKKNYSFHMLQATILEVFCTITQILKYHSVTKNEEVGQDVSHPTKLSNSFGFHCKWKFPSLEGAQEIGGETTGNQRTREGMSWCWRGADLLSGVNKEKPGA